MCVCLFCSYHYTALTKKDTTLRCDYLSCQVLSRRFQFLYLYVLLIWLTIDYIYSAMYVLVLSNSWVFCSLFLFLFLNFTSVVCCTSIVTFIIKLHIANHFLILLINGHIYFFRSADRVYLSLPVLSHLHRVICYPCHLFRSSISLFLLSVFPFPMWCFFGCIDKYFI